jgi:hypothetical protein
MAATSWLRIGCWTLYEDSIRVKNIFRFSSTPEPSPLVTVPDTGGWHHNIWLTDWAICKWKAGTLGKALKRLRNGEVVFSIRWPVVVTGPKYILGVMLRNWTYGGTGVGGWGVGEGEGEEKGTEQDIHAGDGVPGVTDRNALLTV